MTVCREKFRVKMPMSRCRWLVNRLDLESSAELLQGNPPVTSDFPPNYSRSPPRVGKIDWCMFLSLLLLTRPLMPNVLESTS